MTRVFTDGAEFGDTLFFDNAGAMTASSSQARSGTYSYSQNSATNTCTKNLSDLVESYFRFGIYSAALSTQTFLSYRHSTTALVTFALDALNRIVASVGGSGVATATNSLSASTWHLIEIYIKIDDNPNGRIVLYMDGIKEIDFTGDTKPGTDAHVDNLLFYRFSVSGASFWDDFALNNTSGGADNSWCGDGHVELLTPMTGGTYQWAGSDGDSVDNYALVDDIPPNSDTDYVKDSTAGHQDIYTLTDFTATGKVPLRVWAEVRAKDNDSSGGQIKLGFKTVGGTTHLSDSAKTLSGTYARVVGDEETVTPDDSAAWEDADLDGLQLVIECE